MKIMAGIGWIDEERPIAEMKIITRIGRVDEERLITDGK